MRVVLGLGSNVGDRLATLRAAVERIRLIAHVAAVSRVYESAAVGPPQPAYLNAAVLVDWEATPHELLDATQAVELALGRVRTVRWGPRTLDVDLLWIEGLAVDDARLVVPHPELVRRDFALVPLLDLVPDARDPRSHTRYAAPANPALSLLAAL